VALARIMTFGIKARSLYQSASCKGKMAPKKIGDGRQAVIPKQQHTKRNKDLE
jgi:hypothetical protein